MTVPPSVARPAAPTATRLPRRSVARRFTLHYLEMVLAMIVGMVVLGPVESLLFDALGWSAVTDRDDVGAMLMAANMTAAMGAWMRIRGHRWRPVAEMGAAMFLPFAVLLVPLWLGLMGYDALMLWGHVLMLVGMLVAMLARVDEYLGHCH